MDRISRCRNHSDFFLEKNIFDTDLSNQLIGGKFIPLPPTQDIILFLYYVLTLGEISLQEWKS